jgi:hypothetical protein
MGLPDMSTTPFRLATAIVAVAAVFLASAARAGNFNETNDGDLSGTPGMPTTWELQSGANQLVGSAGLGAAPDYDLLAFTIPAGHQLNSLVLDAFSLNASSLSFVALQPGGVWTTGLGNQVAGSTLIGWALFDDSYIGLSPPETLLLEMGQNAEPFNPGNGIVPPLGAGTYTMLLQDTGGVFNYGFTFNVAPVPEPTGIALAGFSLAALALRGIRNGRQRSC